MNNRLYSRKDICTILKIDLSTFDLITIEGVLPIKKFQRNGWRYATKKDIQEAAKVLDVTPDFPDSLRL